MIIIILSSLLLANTYMYHDLLYMLGMIKSWWKLI